MSQTTVFVYTMNRSGKVGAWSRYEFPFAIDDWTILGRDLYLRHGDYVSRLDASRETDEVDTGVAIVRQPFEWFVQWPWLDWGAIGVTKQLDGFDIVGTGVARIQFGFDQSNGGLWTAEWAIPADSVPGQLLPMPLAAPSLAVRVSFTSSDEVRTGLDALTLHLQDFRAES